MVAEVRRWADITPDGIYRRFLGRDLAGEELFPATAKNALLVAGLNPSTADGLTDDQTITVLLGFTRRWGHDALWMVNAFPFRATYPRDLWAATVPRVCPGADEIVRNHAREAGRCLVAWGSPNGGKRIRGIFDERLREFLPLFGARRLCCLGTTKDGQPRHPLRIPSSTQPQVWRP